VIIVKRKWPERLDPKDAHPKPLKSKSYIYEVVENTEMKKEPDLRLILTSYVDGKQTNLRS